MDSTEQQQGLALDPKQVVQAEVLLRTVDYMREQARKIAPGWTDQDKQAADDVVGVLVGILRPQPPFERIVHQDMTAVDIARQGISARLLSGEGSRFAHIRRIRNVSRVRRASAMLSRVVIQADNLYPSVDIGLSPEE